MKSRFAFVVEQTLGHVAHTRNLETVLAGEPWIEPTLVKLPFAPRGRLASLPGARNWSLRASLMGRGALRKRFRRGPLDAVFIHTQVAALLSVGLMRAVPTIVSLDATPANFDDVGVPYGHRRGRRIIENFKAAVNRRALLSAAALVTWSKLAANSLVRDYDVPASRIHVIPPGVELERFSPVGGPKDPDDPVRVLFVGGDFVRKGGPDLVVAMEGVRGAELDIVTSTPLTRVPPGVRCRVHTGLRPGDGKLHELYARADVFAMPSRGDCLPQALAEAAAAGLPLVGTATGAVPEIIVEGSNGYLVPTASPADLRAVLCKLVADHELRRAMGRESLRIAIRDHDATTNHRRIFWLMAEQAGISVPARVVKEAAS